MMPEPKGEERDSPEAASGKRVHAALALVFGMGMTLDEASAAVELQDDEPDTVKQFAGAVESIEERNGGAIAHICEESREDAEIGITGTPDLVSLCADGCVVILDYKSGWGKQIDATLNLQLRGYAILVAKAFPDSIADGRKIKCCIISRVGNRNAGKVVEYGAADIASARDEISAIVATCQGEDAPRNTSLAACRYCRANGNPQACPESIVAAKGWQDVVAVVPVGIAPLAADVAPQVRDWFQACKVAEAGIAAFKAWLREYLKAYPDGLPGLALKPGKTSRKIIDPEKVFSVGFEQGWFTQQQFVAECVSVSLPSVETLARKSKDWTAKEAKQNVAAALGSAVEESQQAPTVEIAATP